MKIEKRLREVALAPFERTQQASQAREQSVQNIVGWQQAQRRNRPKGQQSVPLRADLFLKLPFELRAHVLELAGGWPLVRTWISEGAKSFPRIPEPFATDLLYVAQKDHFRPLERAPIFAESRNLQMWCVVDEAQQTFDRFFDSMFRSMEVLCNASTSSTYRNDRRQNTTADFSETFREWFAGQRQALYHLIDIRPDLSSNLSRLDLKDFEVQHASSLQSIAKLESLTQLQLAIEVSPTAPDRSRAKAITAADLSDMLISLPQLEDLHLCLRGAPRSQHRALRSIPRLNIMQLDVGSLTSSVLPTLASIPSLRTFIIDLSSWVEEDAQCQRVSVWDNPMPMLSRLGLHKNFEQAVIVENLCFLRRDDRSPTRTIDLSALRDPDVWAAVLTAPRPTHAIAQNPTTKPAHPGLTIDEFGEVDDMRNVRITRDA